MESVLAFLQVSQTSPVTTDGACWMWWLGGPRGNGRERTRRAQRVGGQGRGGGPELRPDVDGPVSVPAQSNRNQLVEVLPDTVSRLEVAFYLTPPEDLAADYPVVAAVLKAAGGRATRKGAYSVAVDTLVWHARLPPSQVLLKRAGGWAAPSGIR